MRVTSAKTHRGEPLSQGGPDMSLSLRFISPIAAPAVSHPAGGYRLICARLQATKPCWLPALVALLVFRRLLSPYPQPQPNQAWPGLVAVGGMVTKASLGYGDKGVGGGTLIGVR